MVMPLNMANWVVEILGRVIPKREWVVRRGFGRLEGWIKSRSNSKGLFLELGISGSRSNSGVFFPGRRVGESWFDLKEALRRVVAPGVAMQRDVHGRSQRGGIGGAVTASRSYKDAAVQGCLRVAEVVSDGSRSTISMACNVLDEARAVARDVAQEETTKVAGGIVGEVAHAVARAVAVEVAREVGRESQKMMANLMDLVKGILDGFSKGLCGKIYSSAEVSMGDGLSVSGGMVTAAQKPSEQGLEGSEGNGHVLEATIEKGFGFHSDSGEKDKHGDLRKLVGHGALLDGKESYVSEGLGSEEGSVISTLGSEGLGSERLSSKGLEDDEFHQAWFEDDDFYQAWFEDDNERQEGCEVFEGGCNSEEDLPFDSLWDSVFEMVGGVSGAKVILGEKPHHGGKEEGKRDVGCTVGHKVSGFSCPKDDKVEGVISVKDGIPSPSELCDCEHCKGKDGKRADNTVRDSVVSSCKGLMKGDVMLAVDNWEITMRDPLNGFRFGNSEVDNETREFLMDNDCMLVPKGWDKTVEGISGRKLGAGSLYIDYPSPSLDKGLLLLGLLEFC